MTVEYDPSAPHVFVSYKREDIDIATRIYLGLCAHGINVWWDADLQVGQRWSEEIDRQLVSADCVVVLWSQRSVDSQWVKHEAAVAKAMGTIVSVCHEALPPPPFNSAQAESIARWSGDPRDPIFTRRFIPSVLEKAKLAQAHRDSRAAEQVSSRELSKLRRFVGWMRVAIVVLAGMSLGISVYAWQDQPDACPEPFCPEPTCHEPTISPQEELFSSKCDDAEQRRESNVRAARKIIETANQGGSTPKLNGACLAGSDLSNFDFQSADMHHVNLTGADLRGAKFAHVTGLSTATLDDARWSPETTWPADVSLVGIATCTVGSVLARSICIEKSANDPLPRDSAIASCLSEADESGHLCSDADYKIACEELGQGILGQTDGEYSLDHGGAVWQGCSRNSGSWLDEAKFRCCRTPAPRP